MNLSPDPTLPEGKGGWAPATGLVGTAEPGGIENVNFFAHLGAFFQFFSFISVSRTGFKLPALEVLADCFGVISNKILGLVARQISSQQIILATADLFFFCNSVYKRLLHLRLCIFAHICKSKTHYRLIMPVPPLLNIATLVDHWTVLNQIFGDPAVLTSSQNTPSPSGATDFIVLAQGVQFSLLFSYFFAYQVFFVGSSAKTRDAH